MRWWTNIPLYIGCYNLFTRFVYATIGSATTSELVENRLNWIFYIVPPVYIVASGVISFLAIVASIIFMVAKKSSVSIGTIAILANIIYIILYIRWMSIQ